MATRVTYHQIVMEPAHLMEKMNADRREAALAAGQDPDRAEQLEIGQIISHVKNGWCQCVSVEPIGGGNPEVGRWVLNVVTFEPVDEKTAGRRAQ